MNLNHIAKKPFFDLFYRTPCMPQMLRAALYDASMINADGSHRGAKATLLLTNQQHIAHSKDLEFAAKQIKEIKNEGNHITQLLSYADLVQLGGLAAVEYCGGPSIELRMGRTCIEGEGDSVQHDAETHGNSIFVGRLGKLGFSTQE